MRDLSVVAVALAGAMFACGREGAPPLVPVDVAVGKVHMDSLDNDSRAAVGAERCTARLVPDAIDTGAGCTLDERLSKGSGVLHYPCSGSGAADAIFGEHRFAGTITDGSLALHLTTEIDWEDGCHWRTEQDLRGEIRGDERNLRWTYSEGPVSGLRCYGSCDATADIEVADTTFPPRDQ